MGQAIRQQPGEKTAQKHAWRCLEHLGGRPHLPAAGKETVHSVDPAAPHTQVVSHPLRVCGDSLRQPQGPRHQSQSYCQSLMGLSREDKEGALKFWEIQKHAMYFCHRISQEKNYPVTSCLIKSSLFEKGFILTSF